MRYFSIIIIFALFCSASAPGQDEPASVNFQKAYDLLAQADKARDSKQYTQAVSLYSDALSLYKKLAFSYPDWQTNVVKFRVSYCSDQIDALLKNIALQNSKKTVTGSQSETVPQKTDKQLDFVTSTAKTFLKNNQNEKARLLLMEGLNIEPDNTEIRFLLGIAQCRAGKYSDAVYILEELAKEDSSNAHVQNLLGTAYYSLGLLPQARTAFALAIKISPDMKEANYNMAQALLDPSDPKITEATTFYDKALMLGAPRSESIEKKLGLPSEKK